MTIEPRDPGRPRESLDEGLLTFATGLREETAELLNEAFRRIHDAASKRLCLVCAGLT
jgi:hypothetical protein